MMRWQGRHAEEDSDDDERRDEMPQLHVSQWEYQQLLGTDSPRRYFGT